MTDTRHFILCADDDPDILESMNIVLGGAGYEVALAPSAAEALKAFQVRTPELMIVDLMMEEIDSGMRLANQVRELGYKGPLFMLSSVGDSLHGVSDYRSLGLDGVLQKPIDPRILLRLVSARLK